MSSADKSSWLDLEKGLSTTAEDVVALRNLRHVPMTDPEYVEFLASQPTQSYEALAAKRGPRGEPFSLR